MNKFPYPYVVIWQNAKGHHKWQSCRNMDAARRLKNNLEKQHYRIVPLITLKIER